MAELRLFRPMDPESNAKALMRAKFGGLIPEMLTAPECLELMLQFANFESDRAEAAFDLMERIVATTPSFTIVPPAADA